MRISIKPPRVGTWFVLITSGLAATRFLVLFFESYSLVRAERQADIDLIELCSAGAAKDSDKFRSVCMQARSEQAAPVFLKAILKSLRVGFSDFSECFNSPSRIAILILFCLSGLALPVVKTISALATSYLGADAISRVQALRFDENDENCQVVVLNGSNHRGGAMQHLASRLRTTLPGTRRSRLPSLADIEEDHGEWQQQQQQHMGGAWTSIKLGKED